MKLIAERQLARLYWSYKHAKGIKKEYYKDKILQLVGSESRHLKMKISNQKLEKKIKI